MGEKACASDEASAMPKFFIHAIDSRLKTRDDGTEFDTSESALTSAIHSAAALAVDEIHKGQTNAAIEVRVERADGTPLRRAIVCMSVSSLLP
ncbi:DUF6894 family protein [Sphingomonas sp. CFBP8993]|uniref:DUF6894 family protein n=1 Tax=Sphingomonas sp. CFBP8993 TaxID=3096526 RepID=UPI002A6B5559|nr:hypothetical protein [Sphingomonas sp. CFBP8993]